MQALGSAAVPTDSDVRVLERLRALALMLETAA